MAVYAAPVSPLASYVVEALLVLAALGAVSWLLIRYRQGAAKSTTVPMSVVGRLPLDGRRCVYLVQVGDRVLVLGGSEAGVSMLSELPAEPLAAAEPPLTPAQALGAGRVPGAEDPHLERADP